MNVKLMPRRKVLLYIAMSLDGRIAKPDGDIRFLETVEQPGEDYGYAAFVASIDTVIWGRKTYDKVQTFGTAIPHADKRIFVITRTSRPATGNITFYSGNLKKLIAELKDAEGKHIYIDGGAELVSALLKEELIDELYISIISVVLGEGILLFKDGLPEMPLKLLSAKTFEKGLTQLHYEVVRTNEDSNA
ncbi:MAG: dihydrofolate reductase family protein [Chitinophagales bacterium]|nr:dihydrofolate reductase family protein [Chitinophagales bacterium]